LFFFFFSSRRRHTRFSRDWSSDVCSSDLSEPGFDETGQFFVLGAQPGPGNPADSAKDVTLGVDFIQPPLSVTTGAGVFPLGRPRSEERRVGKECSTREPQDP